MGVEHHICKGIHPTSSAAGLWELWVMGGGLQFRHAITCSIPYFDFTVIYFGANLVVHTMWPHPNLVQWHTLHHTIHADVYNVNIPAKYDEENSRDYAKHHKKLEKISVFIRHPDLSDLVALI